MTATIELDWPSPALSPNARDHWSVKAKAAASAKLAAWTLAKEAKAEPGRSIEIEFCPPTAHRRDLDNMLASLKPALDGISAAIGVDDSEWSLTIRKGKPVKGGAVFVTVNP